MRTLLFLTLFFFCSLSAKVLYLNYEDVPKRVIKGSVFSITIKTISTVKDFSDIEYSFSNTYGYTILNEVPFREVNDKYYLETFYFLADKSMSKTPNITATLITDDERELTPTTLEGEKIKIISLNPKSNFSGVIANYFDILEYKTTSYDNKHNIIIFTAQAQNTNLAAISFNGVVKQGIESITDSYFDPKVTYFAIVKKELEKFSFTYFNLLQNSFEKVTIPIVVDDDSVTTQTDLKPKDQSKEKLKMNIAIVVAVVLFLFALWRKKYSLFILVLFPLAYIGYIVIPSKEVCIKQGSNIYLLPVEHGTIFETTPTQYILPKEGRIKKFTKVKLINEKIGWVKNEDLCSP